MLWIGSLSGAGLAFLTQVVLARQFTPTEFGTFSAVLATVTLLTPLAGFGIAQYWLKIFGQDGWDAMCWLSGSFRFISISTLLVINAIIIWAFLGPNDEMSRTILLILSVYVLGQLSVELVSAKLQLEERYVQLALWQIMPHFIRLLFIILLAFVLPSIFSLQKVVAGYSAVALIFFAIGSIQLINMKKGSFDLKGHALDETENRKHTSIFFPRGFTGFEVARRSWPFGLAGILYLIYFQSDVILLKYLSGPQAAGIYNVAFVVIAAVYLLPSVIYQKFLLPKLHRWANHDRIRFYQVYRFGNTAMLSLGVGAMLVLLLIMPWGIPFLFGDDYERSVDVIMVLAICVPVRFFSSSAGAFLSTQDHMKNKVYIMAFAAALNLILNVIVIPMFGYVGAAITTLVTEVVLMVMLHYYARKFIFLMEIEQN